MKAYAPFLILGFLLSPTGDPVKAQVPVCGAHQDMKNVLLENFSEVPTSMGLAADGRVVEIFVAPSASWTILVTTPGGVSCAVSAGENWLTLPPISAPISHVPIAHTADHDCFPWSRVEADYRDDPQVLVGAVPYAVFRNHLGFDPGWPPGVDEVGLIGGLTTGLGGIFPIQGGCYLDESVTVTSLGHIQQLLDLSP